MNDVIYVICFEFNIIYSKHSEFRIDFMKHGIVFSFGRISWSFLILNKEFIESQVKKIKGGESIG
jgi:hypothetical protein